MTDQSYTFTVTVEARDWGAVEAAFERLRKAIAEIDERDGVSADVSVDDTH